MYLDNQIQATIKELGLNPSEINMVLCGGHGPFAWGETAAKSVYNGTVMEEICKMALNTLALNPNANELPLQFRCKQILQLFRPKQKVRGHHTKPY